jgi:hypothetical protein
VVSEMHHLLSAVGYAGKLAGSACRVAGLASLLAGGQPSRHKTLGRREKCRSAP